MCVCVCVCVCVGVCVCVCACVCVYVCLFCTESVGVPVHALVAVCLLGFEANIDLLTPIYTCKSKAFKRFVCCLLVA